VTKCYAVGGLKAFPSNLRPLVKLPVPRPRAMWTPTWVETITLFMLQVILSCCSLVHSTD